jgi:Tfp pilus assembly protein PilF
VVYDSEHPDVASTLTNLGVVQERLGELDAARANTSRALGIFERRLGADHPYTQQTRANLEHMEDVSVISVRPVAVLTSPLERSITCL